QQSFLATENLCSCAKQVPELFGFGRVGNRNRFRLMFASLFEQEFDVVPGGKAKQTHSVRQILSHFDSAGANGTGAAKENHFFHLRFALCDRQVATTTGADASDFV